MIHIKLSSDVRKLFQSSTMSESETETTTTTHPQPHPSPSPSSTSDNAYSVVKDVIMWRRKTMSAAVLATMTALWVVMEVYGFNFITIASYIAIFLFSSLFAWANLYRIIYKEEPSMPRLGISERTANEMAYWIKESSEEAVKWMFKVGAQSEWYVFAATVAGLWLLSIIGSSFDLLTLVFIGTLLGMSVPVIWLKYDHKIREYGMRLQMQSKRIYSKIDEKIVQKLMNKVKVNSPRKEKEKKVE